MTQNESPELAEAREKLSNFQKLAPQVGCYPTNEECIESLKSLYEAVDVLQDILVEDDYSDPDKEKAIKIICTYRRWAVKMCDGLGQELSEYEIYYAFVVSFLQKLNVECESNTELRSYEKQFEVLKRLFSVEKDVHFKEIFEEEDYHSLFGLGTRMEYEECKRQQAAFRAGLKENQGE
ncbi:MAG: hypothetical protein FVQ80_19055 [Planctomycetes bacterium]|nr:hypothetical protein [Planctomycetota bacterium]